MTKYRRASPFYTVEEIAAAGRIVGTIVEVGERQFRNRRRPAEGPQPVLTFENGRGVGLGQTDLDALIAVWGEDGETWVGRTVVITADRYGARLFKRVRPLDSETPQED